jgi:bifunctional DNA-binding transcriptional regulator/antitoxin component of YhaV-PrlF toxin-antitoxin module
MKRPLKVKVRKIGTSYGVIIPKEVLDSMKVGEDDTLVIKDIEPLKHAKDIRGMFPGLTFVREHGTDRV